MDERTAERRAPSPLPPARAAANIRRYLDAHRPGSGKAVIMVVAALASAGADRMLRESAAGAPAGAAVRLAIERLRGRHAPGAV